MISLIDELRQKLETDMGGITPFYLRQIANKMERCPKLLNNPKLFRVMLSSKLKDTSKYFKYDNEYDNESSMRTKEVFDTFADDLLCGIVANIPFGLENVITEDEYDFYKLPLGYDEKNCWCMFVAGDDDVIPICGVLYLGEDLQLHVYVPEEGNMLKDGMSIEDDGEIEMNFDADKILQDILVALS